MHRISRGLVDLGGIGKGLAVRWASELLATEFGSFVVDAGGDCYCAGDADGSGRWRIGVEDPLAPTEHIAVLGLRDRAVATSSVRLRRWVVGKRRVHHLIDPRTGSPGGKGLLSVTVAAYDAARAEVSSKALFIAGRTVLSRRGPFPHSSAGNNTAARRGLCSHPAFCPGAAQQVLPLGQRPCSRHCRLPGAHGPGRAGPWATPPVAVRAGWPHGETMLRAHAALGVGTVAIESLGDRHLAFTCRAHPLYGAVLKSQK